MKEKQKRTSNWYIEKNPSNCSNKELQQEGHKTKTVQPTGLQTWRAAAKANKKQGHQANKNRAKARAGARKEEKRAKAKTRDNWYQKCSSIKKKEAVKQYCSQPKEIQQEGLQASKSARPLSEGCFKKASSSSYTSSLPVRRGQRSVLPKPKYQKITMNPRLGV